MTVKIAVLVPSLPSVTVILLTVSSGGLSLSTIVTVARLSPITALAALSRLIENNSSISSKLSPLTVTEMVLLVSPGAKVKVPLVAV